MYGLKSLRENDQFEIESRRACPELVERGRLNLRPGLRPGLEFLHFREGE
jgi:hypothetical protein